MHPFRDRVAVLGFPDSLERYHAHAPAPWSAASLVRLKELGFTAVQLNLAWGARPDDEPLNLEDLVGEPPEIPLNCRPGSEARDRRRALTRERLALARAAGLRTLFHFGAPYNRHAHYGDTPPNCILDPSVHDRYESLIRAFAADFPGVDDLLVYTYDQDAWLCGEFGGCPRCNGVPLHERLPSFLDRLRRTWLDINPAGRLWWEPWELSSGQLHACLERITVQGIGLALHANVAECMAMEVADPWLVRTCRQAGSRGLPVWVEWFLGGLSEEVEPLAHLAHPLVIWRGLTKLAQVPGISGLKEYYGLLPERSGDANLAATALFLNEPDLNETAVLARLAAPYRQASAAVAEAWRLASDMMERHPWDCSWLGREIGRADTDHALSAAVLKPFFPPTPNAHSTRLTVFQRSEDTAAQPWQMEDIGLRCQQAADLGRQALTHLEKALAIAPATLRPELTAWQGDLRRLIRRTQSYAYHLRATCLAIACRRRLKDGLPLPPEHRDELRAVLQASRDNHAAACREEDRAQPWEAMDAALADLERDPAAFLHRWLQTGAGERRRNPFSLTSA